jgi:hypothetical protein
VHGCLQSRGEVDQDPEVRGSSLVIKILSGCISLSNCRADLTLVQCSRGSLGSRSDNQSSMKPNEEF